MEEEAGMELISREEIYFTGKENIEGFASLVSIFLHSMQTKAEYPALINVDNID